MLKYNVCRHTFLPLLQEPIVKERFHEAFKQLGVAVDALGNLAISSRIPTTELDRCTMCVDGVTCRMWPAATMAVVSRQSTALTRHSSSHRGPARSKTTPLERPTSSESWSMSSGLDRPASAKRSSHHDGSVPSWMANPKDVFCRMISESDTRDCSSRAASKCPLTLAVSYQTLHAK